MNKDAQSNNDLIIESVGDDENKNEYFEGG